MGVSDWLNEHTAWMAWTWQTGIFVSLIIAALGLLTVLASRRVEPERQGLLRIATTRGDRFFLSLLGAAFIHLIFLGIFGADTIATLGDGIEISRLWIASGLAILYAILVFLFI
jgi:predicted small integral membrane protein